MKKYRKPILERLYDGELFPASFDLTADPEYRSVLEQGEQEMDFLLRQLNEEGRARLDGFVGLLASLSAMECYAHFACGFRCGGWLMREFLEDDPEPFPRGGKQDK